MSPDLLIRPGALPPLEAVHAEQVRRRYDWSRKAREAQREPSGDWFIWLIKPGRGWGKTRTGAETVRGWVESGQRGRIALVNDTAADVRDVMIEGPDGLLAVCPPSNRPRYEASLRRVTWPNGAVAISYAGEAPGLLRGPQHDGAWCDELAKWKNLQKRDEVGETAWSNLLMGLRMMGPTGAPPRCVVTTTPRAIPIIQALIKDPSVHVTNGTLFDNAANLSPQFAAQMRARFEGTRLGRQELYGEVVEQAEGALWTRAQIDLDRVAVLPALRRIVVAIDPAVTSHDDSDETGLIVAGVGEDGHGYVFDDLSGRYSPHDWATQAIGAYRTQGADRIIGEVNNGGEMIEYTLRTIDPNIPYSAVHASRGKRTRAEPVAALYEQHKVHHVGSLPQLEDQMTLWEANKGADSPDRVDALVWALTELLLEFQGDATGYPVEITEPSIWGGFGSAANTAKPGTAGYDGLG